MILVFLFYFFNHLTYLKGIFNTNYINYDFFICAVAMEFDLKDFKRVCQNSLECSLLTPDEKFKALEVWNAQWNLFIKEIK